MRQIRKPPNVTLEAFARIGPQTGPQTGPQGESLAGGELAAKKSQLTDKSPDRYLQKRADGGFRYRRRVPDRFAAAAGAGWVRVSLKTSDLALARARRDAQERADEEFWSSLTITGDYQAARARYEAARSRAMALGFVYAPAAEIAASEPLEGVLARLEALAGLGGPAAPDRDVDALLGGLSAPEITVSGAFEVYLGQIEAGQKARKSPAQYASWLKVKKRAVANFTEIVGDKPLAAVTRADAQKFHKYWQDRVTKGEVGVNRAERDFGNMRVLFREYMAFEGKHDAVNPFRGMSFGKDRSRSRSPIPAAWIRDVILKPGALAGLNGEARGILLALIETGARPSEICNLPAAHIRTAAAVPHIAIAPTDAFEIKTDSSIRETPLLGVSLAALRAHPGGFPRYRDKATSWSNLVNRYLRDNDLLPPGCTVYGLRHAFEKRMSESGLDYGLRCSLMGHADDRPKYGDGGSLEWRAAELSKIILPFDPSVI